MSLNGDLVVTCRALDKQLAFAINMSILARMLGI